MGSFITGMSNSSRIFFNFRCAQIKTYSWDNAQVVLVGNKCDMEDERVISFERGKQLADSLGLEFFETSAKEDVNVRVRKYFVITKNADNPLIFQVVIAEIC